MGHKTHYIGNDTETRALAVSDLREYIGEEMFAELDAMLREGVASGEVLTGRRFARALLLLPVSGYPVQAWYETICADLGVKPL